MYLKVRKEKGVVKTTPFFCDSHGMLSSPKRNHKPLCVN